MMTLEEKLKDLDDRIKWLENYDWESDQDADKPDPAVMEDAKKFLIEFYQAGGPRLVLIPFDGYVVAESMDYWFDIDFNRNGQLAKLGPLVWIGEETMISDTFHWSAGPAELASYVNQKIAEGKVRKPVDKSDKTS